MPLPALAAAAMEAMLLLTHAHVLFAVGPQHSFEELSARRAYFCVDLLSPWVALAWSGGAGAASPATLLLLALHAAIHLYYIVTWTSKHTLRVLHLSSDDSGRRRFAGGYGAAELAWFFCGTAFDMAVHGLALWRLLAVHGAEPLW